MTPTKQADDWYRVVYFSGGTFYTKARTTSEYMLDPIFIQFMVLSVFLFSALMLALDVPIMAQLILFGAGMISTFFWMSILLSLYLLINKSLNVNTIFTPVLLVPMQVLNAVMMEQVLLVFDQSYTDGFNNLWDISIRTVIIIVCLDIFHGKFVAPQHGKFLGTDTPTSVPPHSPQQRSAESPRGAPQFAAAVARPDASANGTVFPVAPAPAVSDQYSSPVQPGPAPNGANGGANETQPSPKPVSDGVKIGSETFDLATVKLIRSEDHYLMVQQGDQSTMVRGRLRDVSEAIDVSWGLQVNRSVWVAHSAIASVSDPARGPLEIMLHDDTRVRVAEARRILFTHTYQKYQTK